MKERKNRIQMQWNEEKQKDRTEEKRRDKINKKGKRNEKE